MEIIENIKEELEKLGFEELEYKGISRSEMYYVFIGKIGKVEVGIESKRVRVNGMTQPFQLNI